MFASSVGSEHREGVIRVVQVSDGIVAICLDGEFDLRNTPTIDDEIDRTLETGKGLILDMSDATFIDSSVIHVLVRASKAASGPGQAIVLQLGTAAIVERVLAIANIEQVLPRAHDRQEALKIIKERTEST